MGSGSRFFVSATKGVYVGIYISRFPHSLSICISLILINIYIGFGKGYDD